MAVQKYDIRRAEDGAFEERHWSPVNIPVLGRDGEAAYIIHRVEDVTEFVALKRRGAELGAIEGMLRARIEEKEAEVYLRAQEVQEANRRLEAAYGELEERVRERTEELAAANAKLLQAQKLEAVGRLAGGIAHDFNNILTAISGYAHFLTEALGPDDPKRADAEEILKAGQRAAGLTRQLLIFSRQQVLQMRVFDPDKVVRDMEKLIRRLIGEDILLSVHTAPDLGRIKADPGQLEQVIMNLVVNSRDAMPRGGRLSIETALVELDAEYARAHPEVRAGPHVMVAVSDTGVGMKPEVLARVFEPFFTTKEQGKGTGLGLATVYGIVKQSGGSVFVYSEPGQGSVFKLYFPLAAEEAEEARADAPAPVPARGWETVLVAEDDELVRKFVRRVLEQNGYRVLAAEAPKGALEAAREFDGDIHLLVTDLVMPGMRGDELARRLAAERPGIRTLYIVSSEVGLVQADLAALGENFVQKPWTRLAGRKAREVLDGGPSR